MNFLPIQHMELLILVFSYLGILKFASTMGEEMLIIESKLTAAIYIYTVLFYKKLVYKKLGLRRPKC